MKAVAIAAALALLHAAPALAQTKPVAKPKSDPSRQTEPKKAADACREFGAGFVAVQGTGTCVQVRGYLRLQGSAR
jgi:hypothetical protein